MTLEYKTSGTLLTFSGKVRYFNDAVFKKLSAQKRRSIIRIGFYGRAVMKNSMKTQRGKKKGVLHSTPPEPPYAHEGTLKRFVKAAYDPVNESSIVGPELLTGIKDGFTVPRLLNEGGTITRRIKRKKSGKVVVQNQKYEPRPYAFGSPNYYNTLKKVPEILRDNGFTIL